MPRHTLGKVLEEPALSILAIFTVLALAVLPFPILPILALAERQAKSQEKADESARIRAPRPCPSQHFHQPTCARSCSPRFDKKRNSPKKNECAASVWSSSSVTWTLMQKLVSENRVPQIFMIYHHYLPSHGHLQGRFRYFPVVATNAKHDVAIPALRSHFSPSKNLRQYLVQEGRCSQKNV